MEVYKGPEKESEQIKTLLDANEVRISCVEVPPDGDGTWRHGRFSVTVQVNGKAMQTFYRMGEGHKRLIRTTISVNGNQQTSERIGYPPPSRADVLYSLVSDASIFRAYPDIDDFAENYCEGMKFREVKDSWDACKRCYFFLMESFGDFDAVCDAFQDY